MASETSILKEGKITVFPGSPDAVDFDPAELNNVGVREWLLATAVQRIFREISAGKTDAAEDRAKVIERCKTRFESWKRGEIQAARDSVVLTDGEKADAEFAALLAIKRAAGDQRPEKQVRAAWDTLPTERKEALRKKYGKAINKAMKLRLSSKKKPTETEF